MKLELNLGKKQFFAIVLILAAFTGVNYAIAQNNPSVFGHSYTEITLPDNGAAWQALKAGSAADADKLSGKTFDKFQQNCTVKVATAASSGSVSAASLEEALNNGATGICWWNDNGYCLGSIEITAKNINMTAAKIRCESGANNCGGNSGSRAFSYMACHPW